MQNTRPRSRLQWLAIATTLIALVSGAVGCGSGRDSIVVGAVDDVVRSPDPDQAAALLEEFTDAGLDAVAIASFWEPGLSTPSEDEMAVLQTVAEQARVLGLRVFVSVYHRGSATTPLDQRARADFASYAAALARDVPGLDDLVIGNEPNLNRFWLPQFTDDGESAAPSDYLTLLAETYDAVKEVSDTRIWGGALAPRGGDRPGGARPTHSPTRFLQELGDAYRAGGRDRPVMDGFVHHPYPESSQVPVDLPHPRTTSIGIADYEKLVALLGDAFDGTAQLGTELPILYGELGIETVIPPEKGALYEGVELNRPVAARDQAEAYRRALELAACQPTVTGVLIFHVRDESRLEGWQSGVRYVDGEPKSSLASFRGAADDAREGRLAARCEA